jgi:hypothetical protein
MLLSKFIQFLIRHIFRKVPTLGPTLNQLTQLHTFTLFNLQSQSFLHVQCSWTDMLMDKEVISL